MTGLRERIVKVMRQCRSERMNNFIGGKTLDEAHPSQEEEAERIMAEIAPLQAEIAAQKSVVQMLEEDAVQTAKAIARGGCPRPSRPRRNRRCKR